MKRVSLGVLSIAAIIVGMVWGSALSHAGFVHPGLLNNQAEYDLMKAKVAAKAEPWYSAYKKIPDYSSYTPKPVADFYAVIGGPYTHTDEHLDPDGRAAYASALHWIVTGNAQHAAKAKQIVNAWSYKLKSITGDSQKRLEISWKWYSFMRTAEILKHTYSNWSAADQAQFEKVLRTLIIPNLQSTDIDGSSGNTARNNWAAYGAMARLAIGIYLNDNSLFTQAISDAKALINFYIGKFGNPVPAGFAFETCKNGPGSPGGLKGGDLAHTQMALAALVQAAEMAKKQGVNLYGHTDSSDQASLLTALVYHAPFIGYPNRGSDATWPCTTSLEDTEYGTDPKMVWQMAYNQYKHAALKAVATYQGPAGNTNRAGALYDKLTHNYGSVGTASSPSVALSSPANVRVVSAP